MKRIINVGTSYAQKIQTPLITSDTNAYELIWEVGNLDGMFKITAKRADDETVFDYGTINEGIASYTLASDMYSKEGWLTLYLSIVEMRMGIAAGQFYKGTINQFYLRETIIQTLRENSDYDFVVIDTPPSLGALSVNSMAAAEDGVIIVSNLDVMSTRGIESFIESTQMVQMANPSHRGILGILFALYSDRRQVDRQVDNWAKQFLPIPVFDTRIPETANVKKANSSKFLVSQIDKKMKAAYDAFAYEVLYATEHPDEPIGNAKTEVIEEADQQTSESE